MDEEKYIGFGKLLELPSGRVGLELTINDLEKVFEEIQRVRGMIGRNFKVLVLPVKPHNVNEWRTHSVKIGESKYKQSLINEH